METLEKFLYAENITKIFPGTVALDDVSIQLNKGEIHGLVGRNGAGKSTLINILYGALQPTDGKIFINNQEVTLKNPIDGLKYGVSLVPQEPQFFNDLSIAENLVAPNYRKYNHGAGIIFINWKKIYKKCKDILDLLNLNISIDTLMSDTSIGIQQLISIGKALFINESKIILLDEVTSSVGLRDKDKIYDLVNKYKKQAAILFITHKINEVFEICDRVSTIRDGKKVKTSLISKIDQKDVVRSMFGDKYDFNIIKNKNEKIVNENVKILEIKELTRINEFEKISFDLCKNEIVGLVGLKGAGKSELLQTIFGIYQPYSGEILLSGRKFIFKHAGVALKRGIVYLPEDRVKSGLINILTVRDNLLLNLLKIVVNRIGFINGKKELNIVNKLIERFNIDTPTPEQQILALSGGNKQKVLVGRSFAASPEIYLLDEPTRGVDIECKREILRIIREELVRASSIIMTSPEVEDLINICDRIIVMFQGKLLKILKKPFNYVEIHKIMYGNK